MTIWNPGKVRIASERLHSAVSGKKIALMMNHSALDNHARSLIDVLHEDPGCEIAFLFGMEHGVRGDYYAGDAKIARNDPRTGLPVVSLYQFPGLKPPAELVGTVDAVVFCAQDVGVRHWTYTPWMLYLLDAAAQSGTEVILVDRPNPLGGEVIEGSVVEEQFYSIVGGYSYPLRHGMTQGELARYYVGEKKLPCRLTVIACDGWTRAMWGDETGMFWTPPSPNISCFDALVGYATTGLLQSTSVNIGVGTTTPFTVVGAPWVDGAALARELCAQDIPGFFCTDTYYIPHFSSYAGELCSAIRFCVTDRAAYSPVEGMVRISETLRRMYGERFTFEKSSYDRRAGSIYLRESLENGVPARDILDNWRAQSDAFRRIRAPYLLYT